MIHYNPPTAATTLSPKLHISHSSHLANRLRHVSLLTSHLCPAHYPLLTVFILLRFLCQPSQYTREEGLYKIFLLPCRCTFNTYFVFVAGPIKVLPRTCSSDVTSLQAAFIAVIALKQYVLASFSSVCLTTAAIAAPHLPSTSLEGQECAEWPSIGAQLRICCDSFAVPLASATLPLCQIPVCRGLSPRWR